MNYSLNNHTPILGYVFWIFGFMGAHRFYYGKPITGTIWFFTLGLLGVGWIIDLFLIPAMNRQVNTHYHSGRYSYNLAWVLLVVFGVIDLHRFYQRKWITGLLYLVSGGIFMLGVLYDYWTLNRQLSEKNQVFY